ncbi:LOW QUALITY PROTEIN: hypothetical protein CFOL_v3_21658, partial [Cephalotus follicularis]
TTTWLTSNNKTIEANHPPSSKIQINIQNSKIQAAPFKLQNEATNVPITTSETNKIIEQNNYTNKYLHTIGSQLCRIENTIQRVNENEVKNTLGASTPRAPQKDKNKIIIVIQEIEASLDDSVQNINNQLSAIITKPLTSYYYRPTYSYLQIEERGKFTQSSYQSGTIYEWNIDGMNYHLINKLQEMTMVSNIHKIKNNSDKAVANLLTVGFTGQLKGWWDNVLT